LKAVDFDDPTLRTLILLGYLDLIEAFFVVRPLTVLCDSPATRTVRERDLFGREREPGPVIAVLVSLA